MKKQFESCEICSQPDWQVVYNGKIRDGAFGNLSQNDCIIGKCSQCGAERLNENACKEDDFYESEQYRRLLKEPEDAAGFMAEHDIIQLRNLSVLWPDSVRSKTVADIGCAAGSFLDHIAGLAKDRVAVEPCKGYHESLRERGNHVFSFTDDALPVWAEKVDYAFCFSVIEHIRNPIEFLKGIRALIKPGGKLIVSTPNAKDALLELKGYVYQQFFYRTVHRWYFDCDSFEYCSNRAGFKVAETKCVHRFGISNAIAWLRDNRPTGNKPIKYMEAPVLNGFWKSYLESIGVGDYLYFKLER